LRLESRWLAKVRASLGHFEAADNDVVVERIAHCGERIIATLAALEMTVLAMIGGVRDEQTALGMGCDGGEIVEEVIGMRQDDGAGPFCTVVVSGVVDPDGAERGVECAFTAASESQTIRPRLL
jgi:hypothetical protein